MRAVLGGEVRLSEPLDVQTIDDCFFYHVMDLPGHGDAADPDNIDHVPYPNTTSSRETFEMVRRAYWYSHKALKSNAKMIYRDIYQLASQVPQVDIVLLAQILVHLERPIQAMAQAAQAAKETLIIVDRSFEDDRPLAVFLGGKGNYYSWYHHSVGFYREFLPIVGFELVSATKDVYRTNHPHVDPNSQVWTIVAKRIGKGRADDQDGDGG